LVDSAAAPADADAGAGRRRGWRRLWDAPLGVHLAALALVLLALVPVVGTSSSLSADEGAAIVQAKSLSGGDGWIVEHPVPQIDPTQTGANYPLENADIGTKGLAPYAKHPLYPLLLAGADRAGGVAAMVLLSLAGTLAAAALAAALARRIDPALARPTVWVVGLASPLLFDGYLVMAHTLSAALAVGAVLLAVRAIEERSPLAAAALAPCIAAAVLLRTEAVFLAAGLAVAAVVVSRRHGLLVAAAAGTGALGAIVGEDWWYRQILGGAVATSGGSGIPGSGLAGRFHGFVLTWLTTGYDGGGLVDVALIVMLASVVLAAFTVRRRPGETRAVVVLSVTAAAAAVVALIAGPTNVVPGLLMAFPLVAAGLILVDRATLGTPAARLAAGTFALFALGVLATQYSRGGSGEWGGRYFALGIPIAVPVLLAAVAGRGRSLAPRARRIAAGALVVALLSLSAMAIGSLRASHGHNDAMNDAIRRATTSIGGLNRSWPPVVVAGNGTVARLGWPTFDDGRWLLSPGDQSAEVALADRLAAAGETTFVRVTRAPGELPGYDIQRVDQGGPAARTWYVDIVRRR
jgi:hypothetical protein